MSFLPIESPYNIFSDLAGIPLEDGYIYIGTAGLNAEVNQISVYWDSDLTIPAAQPIRTIGGYAVNNGTAANVYSASTDHSILVKDKNGELVYSALNSVSTLSIQSLADLKSLEPSSGQTASTNYRSTLGDGGGGDWYADMSNLSAEVAADTLSGIYAAPDSDPTGASGAWVRGYDGPLNVKWYGAKGDGVTDDHLAIQAAIVATGPGGVVKFDAGVYMISQHLEERTNGGRRYLIGDSQKNTIIRATAGFTSVARGYMLWFGTETGHGSYAFRMRDLRLDANNVATGCLMVQENGQGDIRDSEFRNFLEVGYRTNAATDAKITNCEFYGGADNAWAIVATGAGATAPQDPSGYSFSYSLNTSPSNEMIIRSCWISGISHAIWANGDKVEVRNCTLQSCGTDTTRDDLIVVDNGPFDADDITMNFPLCGPNIVGNWSEGGLSRYAIRVNSYEGGVVEKNFIIGSSTAINAVREGGVLIDTPRTVVRNNVFYQFFTAPPTEARPANAATYITSAAVGSKVYDNKFELTQTGNQPYEEGAAEPAGDKSGISEIFGVVEWSAPTTPILTASSNLILSVVHIGTGIVQINFRINVQTQNSPVFVTAGNTNATYEPVFCNYTWNTASSIRVTVKDLAGTGKTDTKFSFMVFAQNTSTTL